MRVIQKRNQIKSQGQTNVEGSRVEARESSNASMSLEWGHHATPLEILQRRRGKEQTKK
jgi:hypothetical protein